MAHIIGKKINGEVYYYLREMARVQGQAQGGPQRYLGKAADIAAAVAGVGPAGLEPARSRHLAFGDLGAVWGSASGCGSPRPSTISSGSRRTDAAASVGSTYLALATVNRVVDPRCKRGFADWWATTCGDRLVRLPAGALDHRRFWDAMDSLDAAALRAAERAISTRMIAEFGLDLAGRRWT